MGKTDRVTKFAFFDIKFTGLDFKNVLKALPGKLDIKRHSPSILYLLVRCDAFLVQMKRTLGSR